jgi:hypothetical protein
MLHSIPVSSKFSQLLSPHGFCFFFSKIDQSDRVKSILLRNNDLWRKQKGIEAT